MVRSGPQAGVTNEANGWPWAELANAPDRTLRKSRRLNTAGEVSPPESSISAIFCSPSIRKAPQLPATIRLTRRRERAHDRIAQGQFIETDHRAR